MRINTNITALNTYNSYTAANNKVASSVAKLSSGYAINSASDNAAGLAISEKMRAQIRGLDTASENSQSAISLVQTAEGALESSDEILQRMREIAVQSSSDTNEDDIDRDALQSEFSQLNSELDEISQDTTYNNQNLLDGSLSTKNLATNVTTSASGLTASAGNAKAGSYTFGVSVVTTADAITGSVASAPVVSASTVSSYFSGIKTADTVTNSTAQSALLNGNYKITGATVGDDGKITVTATGDNDQTFTATLDHSAYATDSGTTANYDLNFGSDAFTISFDKTAGLGTDVAADDSAVSDLANAFVGTEFTISGGAAHKDAEKAVYATLTGASDVKLEAGMDSVAFDNGVTINFDKLTSADLDTTATVTGATTASTATASTNSTTNLATIAATAGANISEAVSPSYTITSSNSGSDYTFTAHGTNGETFTATATISDTNTSGDSISLAFKDGSNNTVFTLGANTAGGDNIAGATIAGEIDSLSVSTNFAAGTSSYNFEDVFGTAVTGVSSSTVAVNSSSNKGLSIQVGANTGDELEINIDRADSEYLGVKGLDVSTQDGASAAIDTVNAAINQVSSQRAYLGAIENRLDYKIDNLTTSSENLTSAESSIRDVDMASEMTKFTNANILSQAATAMLAQANALPQNVLSLLK